MNVRRLATLVILAVVWALGASASTATPPLPTVSASGDLTFRVERLAGVDAYATAAAVSKRFFAAGTQVAVIATSRSYHDGLAAGPAAAAWGGPVLLTASTWLPEATRAELSRLRPGRIVVVGGPMAISESVVTALRGLTAGGVSRLAGTFAHETAAAISASAFPNGASTAFVATSASYYDGASGGAAGAVVGGPVLLSSSTALPASTRQELIRLQPTRIIVLGGTSAISSTVESQLRTIATTERVAGVTAYDTSVAISARFFGPDRPGMQVVTGRTFLDALAGSAAAAKTRGPVLLSFPTGLPGAAVAEVNRLSPGVAYLIGGTDALNIAVAQDVQRIRGACWSGRAVTPGTSEVMTTVSGTTSPKVAFTLDMGGRLTGATQIVDFLVANQVCTTFFPTSIMAATTEGRAVMAKIAAHPELFEVGNHTVSHCDLVAGGGGSPSAAPCNRTMTTTFVRSEIVNAETTLRSLSGMPIRPYWRPPYGSHNATVRSIASGVGFTKTVMWNRDTIDWDPATTTSQIVSRSTSPLPPSGSIILAHLGGYNTGAALPQVVTTLRNAGYTLTTLSDMRDG